MPYQRVLKFFCYTGGRALTHHFDTSDLKKKRDANVISLKIQSDLWPRKPLQVELSKTDKLRILYIKCAEELKKSAEEIVLRYVLWIIYNEQFRIHCKNRILFF